MRGALTQEVRLTIHGLFGPNGRPTAGPLTPIQLPGYWS
jgi:hypothetical protein